MKDTADYCREYYIKPIMRGGEGEMWGGDSFLSFSTSLMFSMLFIQRGMSCGSKNHISVWNVRFFLCLVKGEKKTRNNMSNGFDASSYIVKADGAGCILTIRFR